MKIVVQAKLTLTANHAAALTATLEVANDTATWLAAEAFQHGVRSRPALQALAYPQLKARGLSAQPALHVIRKVADAYATLHGNLHNGNLGKPGSKQYRKATAKPIVFRPDAAQPYDDRCLSWQMEQGTVSIWTVAGRLKGVRFACSPEARTLLAEHRKGETDLVHRDGTWFLLATCEVPDAPLLDPVDFLGVDLGIVNIATTSDGTIHAGRRLNRHRRQQAELRRKLQVKRTKSAKRVLKRQRRKEQRRARDTNHVIAKRIVTEAQRTDRGIALEDLTGIRDRVRLKKPQRVTLHSWAFHQLGEFIGYKARRVGVPVLVVDPADTSRMCAACGYIDKANRVSQAWFACRSCGVVAHADRNAARSATRKSLLASENYRERSWFSRPVTDGRSPAPGAPAVTRGC